MTKDFIITREQLRTKPSWSDRELRVVSRALPFNSYTHLHIHFIHAYLFHTGVSLAGPFSVPQECRCLHVYSLHESPAHPLFNLLSYD